MAMNPPGYSELLQGDHTLDRTGDRLDATYKAAQETERLGAHVHEQLRQQREQLQRAAATLDETDANMSQSNRMLQSMIQRYPHNPHPCL